MLNHRVVELTSGNQRPCNFLQFFCLKGELINAFTLTFMSFFPREILIHSWRMAPLCMSRGYFGGSITRQIAIQEARKDHSLICWFFYRRVKQRCCRVFVEIFFAIWKMCCEGLVFSFPKNEVIWEKSNTRRIIFQKSTSLCK